MWRGAAIAVMVMLALPYGLALIYRFVPPPSTLMLWRYVQGLPVERVYVPLDQISPALVAAVVTSEDGGFCRHYGIDPGAIRDALRRAEERDDDVRGTSTITQQTAKNLFLWQGRSWIRKVLEAPLALWLTLVWPKERVIEVYLNMVEWGEGIFGVEAAARHAFGVSAAALNTSQGALLAVALPNPRQRDARRPGTLHRRLAERLIVRLQNGGANVQCVRRAR